PAADIDLALKEAVARAIAASTSKKQQSSKGQKQEEKQETPQEQKQQKSQVETTKVDNTAATERTSSDTGKFEPKPEKKRKNGNEKGTVTTFDAHPIGTSSDVQADPPIEEQDDTHSLDGEEEEVKE